MGIKGRSLILSLGGTIPLLLTGLFFSGIPGSNVPFLAIGAAIVLASAAAAFVHGRDLARLLKDLRGAADQFGERDFTTRVDAGGPDEAVQLKVSFNQMAERLERQAERFDEIDRVKSEFVSSVSHELRTPLTTIKALTRLLMRGELSEEKRKEYLEIISVECDRQIDLVLNLLDLSRIEGGVFKLNMEEVDVEQVVASCIMSETASAEKRGHMLTVEGGDSVPPVRADPRAIRRVLSNVIENAIKYTPDGGNIVISTRQEDDQVAISVSDNGRGIPSEDIPRLFDKFHRGRPGPISSAGLAGTTDEDFLDDAEVSGVGLGLYLARTVMNQMGGSIDVETELGRGSTFTLSLPVFEGQRRSIEENTNAEATADS